MKKHYTMVRLGNWLNEMEIFHSLQYLALVQLNRQKVMASKILAVKTMA